jgi:hypothetical protein
MSVGNATRVVVLFPPRPVSVSLWTNGHNQVNRGVGGRGFECLPFTAWLQFSRGWFDEGKKGRRELSRFSKGGEEEERHRSFQSPNIHQFTSAPDILARASILSQITLSLRILFTHAFPSLPLPCECSPPPSTQQKSHPALKSTDTKEKRAINHSQQKNDIIKSSSKTKKLPQNTRLCREA